MKDKNIQYISTNSYVRAVDKVKELLERLAINVGCIDVFKNNELTTISLCEAILTNHVK